MTASLGVVTDIVGELTESVGAVTDSTGVLTASLGVLTASGKVPWYGLLLPPKVGLLTARWEY